MNAEAFAKKKLADWYGRNTVKAPPDVDRREFGAGNNTKIDFRHLVFRDEREMNTYLRTSTPFYISYSAAYYEFPDARPMPKKNWLGADLVFDLDSQDYETECSHSPKYVCDICIGRVKDECTKLLEEFLIPDFGFARKEIVVAFSGNRGFHLHIREPEVREMRQRARKEILEYLSAYKLSPAAIGLAKVGGSLRGPMPDGFGWGGKVARAICTAIEELEGRELAKKLGVSIKTSEKITRRKEEVLDGIRNGRWDNAPIGASTWERIMKVYAVQNSAHVDKNVTLDLSRLMRMPGSLHGDTFFAACEISNLDRFDPFSDPVVLGNEPIEVKLVGSRDFSLKGQDFSLKEGKEIVLPEYAAVYAIRQGLAEPDGE